MFIPVTNAQTGLFTRVSLTRLMFYGPVPPGITDLEAAKTIFYFDRDTVLFVVETPVTIDKQINALYGDDFLPKLDDIEDPARKEARRVLKIRGTGPTVPPVKE